MSNNSKYRKKSNTNVNTAHFLISRFLFSSLAKNINLCGNAQSLLRTLGDLMDANLNAYGKRECTIKITEICYQAGMSDKPAKRIIDQFIDIKILSLVKKLRTNKAVYELGYAFFLFDTPDQFRSFSETDKILVSEFLRVSFGVSPEQFRSFSETHIYNTSYKTSYNTGDVSKEKTNGYQPAQTASNVSPLLEYHLTNKH